jgi:hypothetical protein
LIYWGLHFETPSFHTLPPSDVVHCISARLAGNVEVKECQQRNINQNQMLHIPRMRETIGHMNESNRKEFTNKVIPSLGVMLYITINLKKG